MDFWFDGTLVRSFRVDEAEQSGFERRPDQLGYPAEGFGGVARTDRRLPTSVRRASRRLRGAEPFEDAVRPVQVARRRAGAMSAGTPQATTRDPIRSGKQEGSRPSSARKRISCDRAPSRVLPSTSWTSSGPLEYQQRPSEESLRKVFTCGNPSGPYDSRCDRTILSNLASRAYRRPATAEEIDELVAIAAGARQRGGSYRDGLSVAIAAVLASPNFLFRIERPAEPRQRDRSVRSCLAAVVFSCGAVCQTRS